MELPIMWTGPRPRPSRNIPTDACAIIIGWSGPGSLTPNPGNFENVAVEVLREVRENAAVVTPTGDTGARSVQQQERRAVAGFVIPEHTEIGLQFLQSSS
ncbi:hypothetical protein GCM10020255_109420 [Rhodococcus baikonurensis]